MPNRLYGRKLKASNEKLIERYGGWVRRQVGKHGFGLTWEQRDDLEQSLLVEIFRAPRQYRNPKGINIILKTRLIDFLSKQSRKSVKRGEEQRTAGLLGQFNVGDELDRPDLTDGLNGYLDIPVVLRQLDNLASTERTVLGMTFGVDYFESFSDVSIARKLGKTVLWVRKKRNSAIERLRTLMRIQ